MNKHLEKIDALLNNWIDDIDQSGGIPNNDQVKLLSKLREIYSDTNKKRIDVRLIGKTPDELLEIVESGDKQAETNNNEKVE